MNFVPRIRGHANDGSYSKITVDNRYGKRESNSKKNGASNLSILFAIAIVISIKLPLQLMAKRLMERWGFDYDMASNGQEAVDHAKANQGKYDLCIIDIDMPIMNGFEATKIIRHKLKYFPIMGLTGNLRAKEDIFIKKEMPMDQQHAQELRELAKKNLRRVKFFDGPGNSLIVHKNVTNKISHDFNVKRQLMTTFINRDPDKPTRCELYKESNYLMPQIYLTEEESNNLTQLEDTELEKYPEPAFKRIEDK